MMKADEYTNPPLRPENIDRYIIRASILQVVKLNLPHLQGRCLDVGAGNQPYRSLIESDQTSVSEYVPLDLHDNFHYKDSENTWDGKTMPFAGNEFDCAMATEVLEHCPHIDITLKEIARVLKPNGLFFFTIPFLWPLHDCPNDEYRYTPWSIERHLSDSGFQDIKLWPTSGWDAALAQTIGLWIRRRPMGKIKRKLLSNLAFPLFRYLVELDSPKSYFDHQQYLMTGIAGTARAR